MAAKKTTAKKKVKVESLPKPGKELSKNQLKHVRGGADEGSFKKVIEE